MDFNVVVLAGRVAAPPELRRFESGSSLVRVLITVRTDSPRRRVDVVPVTLWEPGADHEIVEAPVGSAVWATGSVQRRFWSDDAGRHSTLEVVAQQVELASDGETIAPCVPRELLTDRDRQLVE